MATRDTQPRHDDEGEDRDDAVIGKAFWRSLGVIVALGVIGGLVAWRLGRKPAPPPLQEAKLALPVGREKAGIVTVTLDMVPVLPDTFMVEG